MHQEAKYMHWSRAEIRHHWSRHLDQCSALFLSTRQSIRAQILDLVSTTQIQRIHQKQCP